MPYENDPRDPTNYADNDKECEFCGEKCDGSFCSNDCKDGFKHDNFNE